MNISLNIYNANAYDLTKEHHQRMIHEAEKARQANTTQLKNVPQLKRLPRRIGLLLSKFS